MLKAILLNVILATVIFCRSLSACPLRNSFIDFNCDSVEKIVFTGDSIVKGIGDIERNNRGGYVVRVKRLIPVRQVVNLGFPGIRSRDLFRRYKRALKDPNSELTLKSKDSDIFVIAVGVNDYFLRQNPGRTVLNIKRLTKVVRKGIARYSNSSPFVVVALLTPSTRNFQQPFIEAVNELLLKNRSNSLPAYLDFTSLSPELLSLDGLHPTSQGYRALAQIASDYLSTTCQTQMAAKRPDVDEDGVYDIFEEHLFFTSPTTADSDGDALSDREEIFSYNTNPLLADTDGDGVDDGLEIDMGRDPLLADL